MQENSSEFLSSPHSVEIPGTQILQHIYTNIELEDAIVNPVLVVVGPNGSGKDTLLEIANERDLVRRVTTATTRRRRFKVIEIESEEDINRTLLSIQDKDEFNKILDSYEKEKLITTEPFDAYIWMQWPDKDTNRPDHYKKLIKEYDLIENDIHYDNLYGLPTRSLLSNTNESYKLPVIRTDLPGMVTLNKVLKEKNFTPVNIGIVPDSWEQVEEAMKSRDSNCNEKDLRERLKSSKEQYSLYTEILHLYIHNTRIPTDGRTGLETVSESFSVLLQAINQRKITSL